MNSLEQKESNLEEYYQQPQEDYIDLSQYWSILKRRWLPASLVLAASILATGLVTFLQKPIYQAEGKVLFRKMEMDANGKVKEMGKELGTLNSLAIQAIEEFELKNEQGKPLRVSEFQSNLKVQPLKETNVLEISYQSTEPEKAKAVVGRLMDLYIQQNMSADRAETVAARQFIENQLPNNKQKLEQAEEGKSTISINLALMLSQLGFTALLVDTDMRNPTQHQLWGVENELGLSDAIAGTQEAEAIITNVKKNLYLLPAGNAKENPLALVNSKRMNDLVKELARSYDFVLFDTPPLNEAADARIIGSITDGILMVVQPQLVDVDRATATKELLQQYGHKVLGMIVNGVTNQKGFGRESLIESFMNMKRAMENNDSVGIVGDDRDFN
jgi:capsular exopolysaccharide synthesis family protein